MNKSKIEIEKQESANFVLGRTNIIVMCTAAALIVLGFALMAGSPSTETTYNPEIFSTRRIVIGPLFAFLGFIAMGVGIILNKKKN